MNYFNFFNFSLLHQPVLYGTMILMIDITLPIILFFYHTWVSIFRGLCSIYIVYSAKGFGTVHHDVTKSTFIILIIMIFSHPVVESSVFGTFIRSAVKCVYSELWPWGKSVYVHTLVMLAFSRTMVKSSIYETFDHGAITFYKWNFRSWRLFPKIGTLTVVRLLSLNRTLDH